MNLSRAQIRDARGQMIVLFAVFLTVLILLVGLVLDGGNGLVQRRSAQNAADFAALAGARIVAHFVAADHVNGTDQNVKQAIIDSVAATGGDVSFGAPNGPQYVDDSGAQIGYVGSFSDAGQTIPTAARGVRVGTSRTWHTLIAGLAGMPTWSASAVATAKGGYAAGAPAGNVFPAGIAEAFFQNRQPCGGPVSTDPTSACYPFHMTPGTTNVPGGFGWLTFGTGTGTNSSNKCLGYDLGMTSGGCEPSAEFLNEEIGHPGGAGSPPGDSHGCCGIPSGNYDADKIGSLPGNKAQVDCSWYINNHVTITVAVWDNADSTGRNAWYHIVGYAGFQLTACPSGKDIEGVWRQAIYLGPTTSVPGFAGAPLAVQLVQ